MARVEYELGAAVLLSPMIGALESPPTIPAAIAAVPGIYLILSQNANPRSRYLGISDDLQNRFREHAKAPVTKRVSTAVAEQRPTLSSARCATEATPLRRLGAAAAGPSAAIISNPNVFLDFNPYDLEHLFIKSTQHCWPFHTVSNTRKVLPFQNNGGVNIVDRQIDSLAKRLVPPCSHVLCTRS